MTKNNIVGNTLQRIQTMCRTTDGFEIAKTDLTLRGPGDMMGLQQSGTLNLHLADLVDDEPLVRATRDEIHDILQADPDLLNPDNHLLRQHILQPSNSSQWSKIS